MLLVNDCNLGEYHVALKKTGETATNWLAGSPGIPDPSRCPKGDDGTTSWI